MSEWISIPDYNDRIGTECIGCGKTIKLGYVQSPLIPKLCDECKEAINFAKELRNAYVNSKNDENEFNVKELWKKKLWGTN